MYQQTGWIGSRSCHDWALAPGESFVVEDLLNGASYTWTRPAELRCAAAGEQAGAYLPVAEL